MPNKKTPVGDSRSKTPTVLLELQRTGNELVNIHVTDLDSGKQHVVRLSLDDEIALVNWLTS